MTFSVLTPPFAQSSFLVILSLTEPSSSDGFSIQHDSAPTSSQDVSHWSLPCCRIPLGLAPARCHLGQRQISFTSLPMTELLKLKKKIVCIRTDVCTSQQHVKVRGQAQTSSSQLFPEETVSLVPTIEMLGIQTHGAASIPESSTRDSNSSPHACTAPSETSHHH